jgi:hypothetical protein
MKLKLDEKFSLKRETYRWRESDIYPPLPLKGGGLGRGVMSLYLMRLYYVLDNAMYREDSVKLGYSRYDTEFFLYN